MRDKLLLYKPLIIIFLISCLGAAALHIQNASFWMNDLMGLFLCFLAALKFFNLSRFADFFARYDLLAARIRVYALAYPFIELGLGFLYLSNITPVFTNAVLIAVMIVGTAGALNVVRSGRTVQCGCAGASFNLPVGRVTLFENLAMAAMAAFNLMNILH